jgi:hypothetical protein
MQTVKYFSPLGGLRACQSTHTAPHSSENASVETRKIAYTYNIINLFNDAPSSELAQPFRELE